MLALDIILDGDGCWPDLPDKRVIGDDEVTRIGMAALAGGMSSGKPSVTVRIDLVDGSVVVAQTSLALLLMAADMFRARYGDPRTE